MPARPVGESVVCSEKGANIACECFAEGGVLVARVIGSDEL